MNTSRLDGIKEVRKEAVFFVSLDLHDACRGWMDGIANVFSLAWMVWFASHCLRMLMNVHIVGILFDGGSWGKKIEGKESER